MENGPFTTQVYGLLLLAGLQHASADLILFYADEQCAEIAVAEAFVAFTLDDLEENGANHGLGKDLQQVSSIVAVEQDASALQLVDRFAMTWQTLFEHFVIGIRRRRHELHAAGLEFVPGGQYVVGQQ